MAVFATAADAVDAAIAAQRGLAEAEWPETGPLRVRMGINAGDAERRGNDYFGPTINRTARLMAVGHGGQVLLSAAAAALCAERLPAGRRPARPRRVPPPRPRPPRARLPARPPRPRGRVPAARHLRQCREPSDTECASFVGRRAELEAVERRLEDPAIRLLTLTGPGGTGKTSLGIRAAADQMDRFRDGVSFVDLSAVRDADAVLAAVGRAVGVGEAPARLDPRSSSPSACASGRSCSCSTTSNRSCRPPG